MVRKSSPATDSMETLPFNASQAVLEEQQNEVLVPASETPQPLNRSLGKDFESVSGKGFFN